jgi:hypothetical protein
MNYNNNIYEGWHEQWWAMSTFTQGEEKLKEVITINMAQERWCQINKYWMVYSTISLHASKNTKRRNMGQFYGNFVGITTKC